MSTIFADNFKNTAGGDPVNINEVKTDKLTGKTTAGSITIQGVGTATTNLQQGISKHWMSVNMSTAAVNDSFNAGSITDNGVGDFTQTITNPMANAHYANTIGSLYAAAWGQIAFFRTNTARTTTLYRTGSVNYHNNGNATDSPQFDTCIDGDLA
jgi:hypothetical protein